MKRQYVREEQTGPKVEDGLADLFSTMALGQMEEEVLEEKIATFKRPENCGYFVPRVNSEMWACMDHGAKSEDLKDQKRQTVVASAAIVIVLLAQTCIAREAVKNTDLLIDLQTLVD